MINNKEINRTPFPSDFFCFLINPMCKSPAENVRLWFNERSRKLAKLAALAEN